MLRLDPSLPFAGSMRDNTSFPLLSLLPLFLLMYVGNILICEVVIVDDP